MIDAYLDELARSLRVQGRARRRFLAEARDHLVDLAATAGEDGAIGAFGSPGEIAAAFDVECASSRGVHAAMATALGIVATGGSTLSLIHASDGGQQAPVAWTVMFFLAAQVAIVCVALVVLQSLRLRRSGRGAADVALLCRRAAVGALAAALTMFAAGAAQPGEGSAFLLLSGPALTAAALLFLFRAWLLNHRLPGAEGRIDSSPADDIRGVSGVAVPTISPIAVAALASGCAFARDLGEAGSTMIGSMRLGLLEAAMVLVAYAVLRRPLGLRTV